MLVRWQAERRHQPCDPVRHFSGEPGNASAIDAGPFWIVSRQSHNDSHIWRVVRRVHTNMKFVQVALTMLSRIGNLISYQHGYAVCPCIRLKCSTRRVDISPAVSWQPQYVDSRLPLATSEHIHSDPVERVMRGKSDVDSGIFRFHYVFQSRGLFGFPAQLVQNILRRCEAKRLMSCVHIWLRRFAHA